MTTTLLAISAAYVAMSVLLLSLGLTSPFRWWVKAVAIVVTSLFFVEVYFATQSLRGWPGTDRLPARFQLLWTRVVEPDPKLRDAGSIFLWVEQLDENNVPTGTPRSYRMGYSEKVAEEIAKAQTKIMNGEQVEGLAGDGTENDTPPSANLPNLPDNANPTQTGNPNNLDLAKLAAQPDYMQGVVFKILPPPFPVPKP
jgi:hypothetical protein